MMIHKTPVLSASRVKNITSANDESEYAMPPTGNCVREAVIVLILPVKREWRGGGGLAFSGIAGLLRVG